MPLRVRGRQDEGSAALWGGADAGVGLTEARRLGEAAAELLRPLLGVAELSEVLAEFADTCAKLGAPGDATRLRGRADRPPGGPADRIRWPGRVGQNRCAVGVSLRFFSGSDLVAVPDIVHVSVSGQSTGSSSMRSRFPFRRQRR